VVNDISNAISNQTTKAVTDVDAVAAALAKPFQDIAAFIGTDATDAIAQSTAIPALQDGHGQQCWMAMKSFGDIVTAHPVPITFHVINDFETLRLLAMATNNLCSNVHCTQVFGDATAMAQAASPVPINIPTLHALCIKVPQIAQIPAVSVSSTTSAPPATQINPALGAGPVNPTTAPAVTPPAATPIPAQP
jgi:hypothetical protein